MALIPGLLVELLPGDNRWGVGKYAPDLLEPVIGPSAGFWSDIGGSFISESTVSATKDAINKLEEKQ